MLVQGSWSEARDLARVTRVQGSPLERHMATTVLGNLAHCQGNRREAWAMVREVLPRGPDSEPEDGLFPYAIEMLRLATTLAMDEGNLSSASSWLHTHDQWLEWSSSIRGLAESRLLHARLHALQGERESARHAVEDALCHAREPRQPLLLLAAYRFLGQISTVEERYSEAERQLIAALDLAESCAAPFEQACTLLAQTDLYIRTGRAQAGREALNTAMKIGNDLESAPILAEADDLQTRLASATSTTDLTPREIEVLKLVAQGMTDAETAEQLYISPRTVGQHLRSIYNKLGVSSRTAATRIAITDNLV